MYVGGIFLHDFQKYWNSFVTDDPGSKPDQKICSAER